jgi:hypothetical protein
MDMPRLQKKQASSVRDALFELAPLNATKQNTITLPCPNTCRAPTSIVWLEAAGRPDA